ncbi:P-loop containing nucleoside triphosphate hydrolase protein [Blastocladiella britannica]|nr:P-loop containing nucleoside triphosphate hydrolase protein [Blastocladiella britannica]
MDLFRALTGGARFDKKRFESDVTLFQPTAAPTTQSLAAADAALDRQLDFFGSMHAKPPPPTSATASEAPPVIAMPVVAAAEAPPTPLTTPEAITAFRRTHRIKLDPTDDSPAAAPVQSFSDLYATFSVPQYLQEAVATVGYVTPTPIQMQAAPLLFGGRDVLACAPTGSGKTLAYLLPIVHSLVRPGKEPGVRACIVAPTRELVLQIERELKKLVGKKWKVMVLTKEKGLEADAGGRVRADFMITTPMRLVQALQESQITLAKLRHLVFDEADRLLDLGFLEQVDEILAACPASRQTAMFSATLSSTVEALAKTVMRENVTRVIIGTKNTGSSTIDQSLVYVGDESGKLMTIRQHLRAGDLKPPVLIFVQSIDRAKELFRELVYDGMNVDVIHADRTQAQRDRIIEQFRLGHLWILISTDVLARGVDMIVQTVVNYDFPQSTESYIHRIGRTGRAGRRGKAITYFTKDDATYLRSIVNVVKESGCDVPEWMLSLRKADQKSRQLIKRSAPKRATISTMSKMDMSEARMARKLAKREMRDRRNTRRAAEAKTGSSAPSPQKRASTATTAGATTTGAPSSSAKKKRKTLLAKAITSTKKSTTGSRSKRAAAAATDAMDVDG